MVVHCNSMDGIIVVKSYLAVIVLDVPAATGFETDASDFSKIADNYDDGVCG